MASKTTKTTRSILLIGMVSHSPSEKLMTDTSKRDQARIEFLRNQFDTVFTMNKDDVPHDKEHHVTAFMLRNGANSLLQLLGTKQHANKIIDCICLDYVRFPAEYYHQFVSGTSKVVAGPIREFVTTMRGANKLREGCKLIFARCPSSDRWGKTVANLGEAFGAPTYVPGKANPLYLAGEGTKQALQTQTERPYDHVTELGRHSESSTPFCVFTIKMSTLLTGLATLSATASATTPAASLSATASGTVTPKTPKALTTPLPSSVSTWRKDSVLRVKTSFTSDKQCNVSVRPKHTGMQVVFPTALNKVAKKRITLTFPTAQPFGVSPDLGQFIKDKLQEVVDGWRTLNAAQKWVIEKRRQWKDGVVSKWFKATRKHKKIRRGRESAKAQEEAQQESVKASIEVLASRCSRKRKATTNLGAKKIKRRLPLASPTVYTAKKASTYSIPIPVFPDMLAGHVVDLSLALHVYPRNARKRKPIGILLIPKELSPGKNAAGKIIKRKRREFSLGVENGVNPEWLKFVVEYVTYAVSKWNTLREARRWCEYYREKFLELVKEMWDDMGGGKHPVSRFWRIGQSSVPPDPVYIAAFKKGLSWGFDPDADPGSGLICTRTGAHTIYIDGPESVSETSPLPVKKIQQNYMCDIPDSNDVWVPTLTALRVGAVNQGFIVQHNREDPTHYLSYDPVRKLNYLLPVQDSSGKDKVVHVGDEFTFNYGWDKGKDVESGSDECKDDEDDEVESKDDTKDDTDSTVVNV